MSFSTEIFVFIFFPLVFLAYNLGRTTKIRNFILLGASLIFYLWGGFQSGILLIISLFVNYALGLLIRRRKKILLFAVIYNIGMLAVFKYAGFLYDIFNNLFIGYGLELNWNRPEIIQPIGISFFTFSILSYVIDIYYEKTDAQKNIFDFSLYVMLFPKIVSGPIVRYIDIKNELAKRLYNSDQIYAGIRRFCIGFTKKVFLANQMAKVADTIFSYEWALHPIYAWIGVFSYTLNIYLDFSSYSDMAIGIANIFGFHFKENFNYPYISTSIQEFWRRWHISLSSWFKDYIYIPLGGNRKGKTRTYINQLVVFFLTGLWHGASWNFVIWGLYHGVFLTIEKLTRFCLKIPKWLSYIYTMVVVMIGWVFFRIDNLENAFRYIGYMFGFNKGILKNVALIRCFTPQYLVVLVFSIIVSVPIGAKVANFIKLEWIKDLGVLIVFFVAICYMVAGDYNPFIYARF